MLEDGQLAKDATEKFIDAALLNIWAQKLEVQWPAE